MIKYVVGDLLQGDCTVIAHQANCGKVFGAGIAAVIKKIYPEAYEADKDYAASRTERLGKCSTVVTTGSNGLIKQIFNLYGQDGTGRGSQQTNYIALESALELMMDQLNDKKAKIGVPYLMGCDLAGGDWDVVTDILWRVSTRSGRTIHVVVLPKYAKQLGLEV